MPAAILAAFVLLVSVAVVSSSGRRPDEIEAVAVDAPASVGATSDEPGEKAAPPPSITPEQVRQSPTDLTNFRERWQQLRKWYVSLPPARQGSLFPYENIMRAKLDFATDPQKACHQLDQLYDKASSEMK